MRHYVAVGLLKPTMTQAGSRQYRRFSDSDLERVYLIRIGAQAGIRLGEMQPLLDDIVSGRFSFQQQREVVQDQLTRVDQKIAELLQARELLRLQFQRIDERERAAR